MALLTFCVLVLRNGFTVTGKSACASPENFNAQVGREVAREDAVNQVWSLMGYALKERLSQRPAKTAAAVDIDAAVTRFLGWRLPDDFNPDCGISFQREGDYDHPEFGRTQFRPIGTNLFTAQQARAMLEHCLLAPASDDFPLGKACDLSGDQPCEACQ